MAWLETPHVVRSARRVRSKGSVRLHAAGRVIVGRLVDLAVGGVCIAVRAEIPIGLLQLVGEVVRLELRLDAGGSRQFALIGRVLRVSLPARRVAIAFGAVDAALSRCIQDELCAAVEHDRLPHILLVDTIGRQRDQIASAFRRAGCQVAEASTPLEAISYLDRARFEPWLIAIADTVPEAIAEHLRAFVLDEHPGSPLIAIGGASARRAPVGSWLCSTGPALDLETRVGRVLTTHGACRQSAMAAWAPAPDAWVAERPAALRAGQIIAGA